MYPKRHIFFFTRLLFHKLVSTFFSISTWDSRRLCGIDSLLIDQSKKESSFAGAAEVDTENSVAKIPSYLRSHEKSATEPCVRVSGFLVSTLFLSIGMEWCVSYMLRAWRGLGSTALPCSVSHISSVLV